MTIYYNCLDLEQKVKTTYCGNKILLAKKFLVQNHLTEKNIGFVKTLFFSQTLLLVCVYYWPFPFCRQLKYAKEADIKIGI